MRAHARRGIRRAFLTILLPVLFGCDGLGFGTPTDTSVVPEDLELSVRLDPRFAVAGDTVDVVVTVGNTAAEPVELRGPTACVVSSIDVRFAPRDEPVMFEGGGEHDCAGDASLSIGAADSVSVRVPVVVWQVPDPARPETGDEASVVFPIGKGPPLPFHFRFAVRSDPLGKEVQAESTLNVLESGWHHGFAEECDSPLPEAVPVMDDPYVVAQPEAITEGRLRVRFEVHPTSDLRLQVCNWWIVAALDRRTLEGWDLGTRQTACSDHAPGSVVVSGGGCLRGVWYRDYELGEYRLRIWTGLSGDSFLTTELFPA